ncbi:MAG: HEAT repeat domain-containing protein [Verrucomicrobiae bacterium]|nr:HEAT repeat domain-containing protein [Verrucomicrobiae bacterium]
MKIRLLHRSLLCALFFLAVACSRNDRETDSEIDSGQPVVTFGGKPTNGDALSLPSGQPIDGIGFDLSLDTDLEAREFSELSPEAKAELQKLIADFHQYPNRRSEILEQIESDYYGKEILPLIREILGMGDESLSLQAVEALAGNTSPDVIPVLDSALKNSSEEVRLSAILAASQVRDEAFVGFIGKAFNDTAESVRLTSLDVLENQTRNNRLKIYDVAMDSAYSDVNMAAIVALEMEASPDSIEILIKGLDSPNADVRAEAQVSLEFQLDQTFDTAAQAREWWTKNRNRYDQELFLKETGS